ncbi:MAG TPA: S41 family peptidase [Chthonomonadaceae bacterium]|nr:S41 family peptidase [Chthonomonadaceae bacterium]
MALSTEKWREDLRFFVRELTHRHRNPYHLVSKEAFEKAVAALEARIPALQEYEVVVGMQSLAAMIGDGHTFLGTGNLYRFFPFEAFWFGNELRVVRTIPAYRQALGARIVQIGDCSTNDVQKRLQALIPQGENEWYVLNQSAYHIVRVEPLAALGVLPDVSSAPFTFEDDTGKRFVLEVAPVLPNTSLDWVDAITQKPLYLQKREEAFWFTYLPDAQTAYVQFRRYTDLDKNAERLFAFVESHAPKRLVIDMRQNGGGNYTQAREHLIYKLQMLPSINRQGRLFVVIGRGTFSAAMTNATDFRRETEAILVGEPTGARPNGYQELSPFTLPNSKLKACCSILRYRFQDQDTPAVLPDKRIDPDWTAYKAGRDPVMEWILAQPK